MKRIGSCILTLLLFGSVCYAGDEVAKTSGNLADSVHLSRLVEKFGVRSNATAVEGYSFVTLIPFVTKAQNTLELIGSKQHQPGFGCQGGQPRRQRACVSGG